MTVSFILAYISILDDETPVVAILVQAGNQFFFRMIRKNKTGMETTRIQPNVIITKRSGFGMCPKELTFPLYFIFYCCVKILHSKLNRNRNVSYSTENDSENYNYYILWNP